MTTTADAADATFDADWDQWHTERERYYGEPLGWVSITGLYWLTDVFAEIPPTVTTGAVAPPENRLPVAIEAGEKNPR